jgi:PhnB protein
MAITIPDKTHFAPQLYIPCGIKDISFYEKALGAIETKRWTNGDGTIHVAEFLIGTAIFHVHEENKNKQQLCPETINGTTVHIGLFVEDVDFFMNRAMVGGAELINPATSYDYGYRQGEFKDPFGHTWQIQQKI